MSRTENVELTVLCLIENGDKILLQNRQKKNWRGYALPGGHVERGESFIDAVIREMKEETGLTILDPRLIETFQDARDRIAPAVELRLQIGLSRHCPIDYLEECLKHFWGRKEFYSIDLYGDELAQPIENFIPIYEKAADHGLVLKAHVGEWGTAKDVIAAVKALHLDEVQHGIAAVQDDEAVYYLAENNIRLNITPSSNVLLGRVSDISNHPIAQLYRRGVKVTINSDDVLIFDSDVSKEYLRLFQSGCLSAEELDDIRMNGLVKTYK